MAEYRISAHPILSSAPRPSVTFFWHGEALAALAGENIASALFANGVRVFGHHPKDGSPQGIFCANGQCAQCLVLADGMPVKSCMTPVTDGMRVEPVDRLPELPKVATAPEMREIEEIDVPVLIIGGGPAGMSAAIQLGQRGVRCLLIDDKDRLGGKLVLQTHRFFGSINAVYAGTRGIDIATKLEAQVRDLPEVDVWLNSTALAVFSDRKVGVLKGGNQYALVKPQVLLVAAGAREKSLAFRGNTLPGVYGAGAFQTLVNRDLVRAAERLFIVGGGNVGLIAGYHALQAGIQVVGLVEALPECGGYKVHKDKLHRMGVPIYTSHTILSANGDGRCRVRDRRTGGREVPPHPRDREVLCVRHRAHCSGTRSGRRVLFQGAGFRADGLCGRGCGRNRRGVCSHVLGQDQGAGDRPGARPRRGPNPTRLVPHGRNPALEAGQGGARGHSGGNRRMFSPYSTASRKSRATRARRSARRAPSSSTRTTSETCRSSSPSSSASAASGARSV